MGNCDKADFNEMYNSHLQSQVLSRTDERYAKKNLLRQEVEDISKRDYVFYLAIAHTRLK
ncbi:hypothetical protein WUBG_12047, partial [Wuchereria bancrofti]